MALMTNERFQRAGRVLRGCGSGLLLLCAVSYTLLQNKLTKHTDGENALLAEAVGSDLKGKISMVLYIAAIPLAFVQQNISHALYVIVALIWLVPDKRIEKKLGH